MDECVLTWNQGPLNNALKNDPVWKGLDGSNPSPSTTAKDR